MNKNVTSAIFNEVSKVLKEEVTIDTPNKEESEERIAELKVAIEDGALSADEQAKGRTG